MRSWFLIMALVPLAGCGGQEPASNTSNQQIAVRSPEQDELHRLNDMNRNIGLKRAILASGMPCRRVTASGYVAEHGNLSMWTATCSDRREWAVFVGPDGSAQVRPCQDMARFKLPQCKIAPDGTKPASASQSEVRPPSGA